MIKRLKQWFSELLEFWTPGWWSPYMDPDWHPFDALKCHEPECLIFARTTHDTPQEKQ